MATVTLIGQSQVSGLENWSAEERGGGGERGKVF